MQAAIESTALFFLYLIGGIATWRLTSLVVREDGPRDIIARLRRWIGVRYNHRSEPYGLNVVAQAILCFWCASIWVGLGLSLIYRCCVHGFSPGLLLSIFDSLVLSGIAIQIDERMG